MEPDKRVKSAFLWTSVLNAPFWALYGMLIFILYKDLHATAFEISLFIALKPGVSLLSIYWSALVHKRPDRLRINVIAATILGYFPFFIVPFYSPTWFLIAASAFYMMLVRGVIPAWMELLKLHVPNLKRERLFSIGSAITYAGGIVLAIFFGQWLDSDSGSWRLLFPLAALISLPGIFFVWRIPVPKELPETLTPSAKELLLHPWKKSWQLVRTRPDFWRFQLGFMIGGGALMIMLPALPSFFVDNLNLSYTELAIALSICKGIGFALTSRIWASAMGRFSIFKLSSVVTLLAGLFPFALLLAGINVGWVYGAYLIYGVMQAGSELSWNLSGPHFAKNEDSSSYSAVNILTVGLRGLAAPFLGALLCANMGAPFVLILGGLLCAVASLQLARAQNLAEVK